MIEGNIYEQVRTAIEALTPQDRAHADVFNNIFQQLISNDMTVEIVSKNYTDQQMQLVTETGVPKLVSYRYSITATAGQTVMQIPLATFSLSTDTEIVIKNTTVIDRSTDYTITESGTVTFITPLSAGTTISFIILKNVPMGPDGSVHGKVIANDTIAEEKLDTTLKNKLSSFTQHSEQNASTTQKGHVQLSNDTNSTSETLAPTMKALNEVKQYANNGKDLIATAIVGKGGTASSSDTFAQLASAISVISTGKKWASGKIATLNNNASTTISDLGFVPSLIIFSYNTTGGANNVMTISTRISSDVGVFGNWFQTHSNPTANVSVDNAPTDDRFTVKSLAQNKYNIVWYAYE